MAIRLHIDAPHLGSCMQAMLVFGGVNPAEDLNDIAVFVLGRQPVEECEGQAAGERVAAAIEPVALPF